jgi:hypothetical protein
MIVIRARISSTLELDVVGDTTQSITAAGFDHASFLSDV